MGELKATVTYADRPAHIINGVGVVTVLALGHACGGRGRDGRGLALSRA
jgi:hypothetical protein